MQCLPSPEDVKVALEVYKLSLEIKQLEKERDKLMNTHQKFSEKEEMKDLFFPSNQHTESSFIFILLFLKQHHSNTCLGWRTFLLLLGKMCNYR